MRKMQGALPNTINTYYMKRILLLLLPAMVLGACHANKQDDEVSVTVTLKGRWEVKETPFCKVLSVDKKQTTVRFTCKDGLSFEAELTKR